MIQRTKKGVCSPSPTVISTYLYGTRKITCEWVFVLTPSLSKTPTQDPTVLVQVTSLSLNPSPVSEMVNGHDSGVHSGLDGLGGKGVNISV